MMKFIILALLLCAGSVEAATRYAGPAGAGSTCSSPSPCTITEGISQSQAGDTLLLKDGTYTNGQIITVRAGTISSRITIAAENRRLAIVRPPETNTRNIHIKHSYITLRGLRIENRDDAGQDGCIDVYRGSSAGANLLGVTIEDNQCLDMPNVAIYIYGADGLTIRYNDFDNVGMRREGEGFYMSSCGTATDNDVINTVIYGNRVNSTTNNLADYKCDARSVNIHHNIFENHVLRSTKGTQALGADDGMIRTAGEGAGNSVAGNKFDNNIVRDAVTLGSTGIVRLGGNRVDVRTNVFHTITAGHFVYSQGNTTWWASIVANNKACGTPSTTDTTPIGSYTGNSLNQAQGVCDTDVTRIIGEVAARPVIATAEVGLVGTTKVRITLTNQSLATLDGAAMYSDADLISAVDITKFTCSATGSRICVDGTPATINSAAVVGTNIVELTLAVAIDAGEVVTLNGSLAAIISTGNIGATWVSELASSAAFTNQAVTNNVSGPAPEHVLDQKAFQFYGVRTDGGLLTKLPHTAAALNTNIRTVPTGSIILGIQIDGTIANPPPLGVLPYYQKSGAGGYAAIPGAFAADNIRIGTSQTGTDVPAAGEAVATCLTGILTPVAGLQVNSANAVPTFDLTQNSCIVNRWSIEFDTDVTAGDYYEIRLYNQDTSALDTYTVTPRIDIISDRAGGGT
jgi:hypothetical protein